MSNTLEVRLSEDQLEALAEKVAARLAPPGQPYTAREAANALAVSIDTIRNWIKADRIRVVPGLASIRIPRSEIERLQQGRPLQKEASAPLA